MSFKSELEWIKPKKNEQVKETFTCPYCSTRVSTNSDLRLYDVDTGVIRYHIFKCSECYMPVIINAITKEVIPPSQVLPFDNVSYLPQNIEKLYNECRKSYLNECYHSVVMVARALIMHIAVDKGEPAGKSFLYYVNQIETAGYIGRQNKVWVDKIRTIGNDYTHDTNMATQADAEKVIKCIKQLLGTIYEMPQIAV